MAVKCNIVANVLTKVTNSQWGFATDTTLNRSIIENYIEYLGCEGVELKPCSQSSDPCNTLTDLNCNINLTGISFELVVNPESEEDISFYLAVGDILNAKEPYTYKWIYDEDKFDLIGDDESADIKLKIKEGYEVDLIVSPISVEITDANGCKDTKTCYYTPTGMKCNNSYVPCYPVGALNVSMINVPCYPVQNLTVSKFNSEGRECMPLLSRDQFKIWRYDPDFNILTELFSYLGVNGSSPFVTRDIAMTNDRFWVYSSTHIYEYIMTLSPFSVVFNRQIAFPAGTGWDGAGLTALDNDTLVGGDEDIIRYDISGGITDLTGHTTVLFSLPTNMVVTGDLIYDPVAEKYYILYYNLFNSNQSYLGVFSNVGVLLSNIAMPVPTLTDDPPLGMYHYKNELYIISLFGMVYSVDKTTLAITFVKAAPSNGSLGPRINGATQPLNCTNL